MEGICATCLTVGRHLAPLKIDEKTFSTLFDVNVTDPICWECQATVLKFIAFKNRVVVAHDTLQRCEANFKSLSRLSYYYVANDTCDEVIIEGIKKEVLDCLIDCGYNDTDEDVAHNVKLENDSKCLPASYCKTLVNNTCDEGIIGGNKTEVLDCLIDCREKDTDDDDVQNVKLANDRKCLPASCCQIVVPVKSKVDKVEIEEIKEKAIKLSNNYFKIKQLTMEEVEQIRRDDLAAKRYMNSLYKCKTCIFGYGIKKIWESHNYRLHSEESGSHICSLCQQRFKREDILKNHYNAHFKCYVCLHCDFAHPCFSVIQVHYSKKHNKDGYRCDKCLTDCIFPTRGRLMYHQKTMHQELPFCPVAECGKTFKTNDSLKTHMLQHNGGTPRLECTICHKQVKGEQNMRAHMKTHMDHSPPPTEFLYCISCDRQFTCRMQYDRHMKYSAPHRTPDVLKYQCAHCGKRFMQKHYMEDHVLSTHLNKRDFVCDVCKKSFNTVRLLTQHRSRHDGPRKKIRDKVCEHCGKAFMKKKTLEDHINSHTGARPFECQVCGDRFSFSAALFNHNRIKHENFKRKKNTK